MPHLQSLPWMDPLLVVERIPSESKNRNWVLLYSGVNMGYSGRYSYLAYDPLEEICSETFSDLEKALQRESKNNAMWFGYLGYGLKNDLEILPSDTKNWLPLPALWMTQFQIMWVFDHDAKTITVHSPTQTPPVLQEPASPRDVPNTAHIYSNMTTKQYKEKVSEIISRIQEGELYQANLTRKFMGEFEAEPDSWSLFMRLCTVSPAPYSAFLKLGDVSVLSSSPELFLSIDKNGEIRTRPIKGTIKRGKSTVEDAALKDLLANSAKNKAENLMITDLMRNDLSRTTLPGTVEARSMFEITSHASIHHMSSTVTARKSPYHSALDVIKACFPPGSMTGAPKIRAMQLCSRLELLERGIYSGAIGWLGKDDDCELSVVIRTMLLKGKKFEFQVGGGIVADSTPEDELQETIHKATGLLTAIGLNANVLTDL